MKREAGSAANSSSRRGSWAASASLEGKRTREALPHANEAVRLAPWSPAALDTLAGVAEALGRCDEALAAQRRAVDNLPDWVNADGRKPYLERRGRLEETCGARQGAARR